MIRLSPFSGKFPNFIGYLKSAMISITNRCAIVILILFCVETLGYAQEKINPFASEENLPVALRKLLNKGSVYQLLPARLEKIIQEKPQQIDLRLFFENKEWTVVLKRTKPLSPNFVALDATGKKMNYAADEMLHYAGTIMGKPHSLAAISISANKMVGVLADEQGNINMGELPQNISQRAGQYIMYREENLVTANSFICGTENLPHTMNELLPGASTIQPENLNTTVNAEPVDIYLEADFQCYKNNANNIQQTINWATALFNIVQTLYNNDSVFVQMSGIKVWNQADPYVGLTTTNTVLYAFASNMTSGFPGDLAHLLSQRSLGGGVAFLNVLCSSAYYRTGFSANLSNSFNSLPNYSWSTMVVTHETGHNMASNHTQWCGWVGGAIDNCYTTEGGCPPGPAPLNGGTIMSYCHLTGYGINLANGFGPLPGTLIRNTVRNNNCIYPRISFSKSSESVSEELSLFQTGCNHYRELQVKLALNTPVSLPAIITLLPTAQNSPGLQIGPGKDVEVSPMNFTLNDTTPQLITIKIYDDAYVEPIETMRLDYSLAANGCNAQKYGTYLLQITSGDYAPDSVVNQLIFEENFENPGAGLGSFTENLIYGASSPNRWKVLQAADSMFLSKAAVITNNGLTATYSGSQLSDSTITRLESVAINTTGFKKMKLNYRFKCVGEGVGQGGTTGGTEGTDAKDFMRILYSIDNGVNWVTLLDNIYGRSYPAMNGVDIPAVAENKSSVKLGFEWHNNSSVVNLPSLLLDSISLVGAGSSDIQFLADANNKYEAQIGPFETVHFYNPVTKNIMASLRNKSSHNYGCSTVELVRTGLGATAAWPGLAAEFVSNKIFKFTSEFSAGTNEMEFQLYYTRDEMNAWAAATGNAIADAAIVASVNNLTSGIAAESAQFATEAISAGFGVKNDFIFKAVFTNATWFGLAKPGIRKLCEGSNSLMLVSEVTGTTYQWQIDSGAGFTNLVNNANYNGVQSLQLQMTNLAGLNTGNVYRCRVQTAQGIKYSVACTIKFTANWTGNISSAWEDAQNWDCNAVPGPYTDVIIGGGTPFAPVLNNDASIKSLIIKADANLTIPLGKILNVQK